MKETKESKKGNPLWTRDFTILTLGSVVSMLGNAMSGFAMSLMVLDISGSTLLFALYVAMYTLPMIIMPVFSGAILDRFSRKKTIYTLDFLSAALYLLMGGVLMAGWFSFPLFLIYCFVLGSIESIYMVAYESFYPLLITEGNYQKAYSIASVLETFSAVMIPVGCRTVSLSKRSTLILPRTRTHIPSLTPERMGFALSASRNCETRTEPS